MHILGKSQTNLRPISGIPQAYRRHISVNISCHILGISQTNIRYISSILQPYIRQYIKPYLRHTSGIPQVYPMYIYKLYTFSTHPQHYQISVSIASQSCNFMLVLQQITTLKCSFVCNVRVCEREIHK